MIEEPYNIACRHDLPGVLRREHGVPRAVRVDVLGDRARVADHGLGFPEAVDIAADEAAGFFLRFHYNPFIGAYKGNIVSSVLAPSPLHGLVYQRLHLHLFFPLKHLCRI